MALWLCGLYLPSSQRGAGSRDHRRCGGQGSGTRDGGALVGGWWSLAVVFIVLALSWRVGMLRHHAGPFVRVHDLRQLAVERVLHPHGMAARRAPGEILSIASSDTDRVAGLAWLIGVDVGRMRGSRHLGGYAAVHFGPLGLAVLVATPVMLVTMQLPHRPVGGRSEAEQSQPPQGPAPRHGLRQRSQGPSRVWGRRSQR